MKTKLSKMPPLRGTPEEKTEQIRNYTNRLVEELIRAMEEQEREIERLRKERK